MSCISCERLPWFVDSKAASCAKVLLTHLHTICLDSKPLLILAYRPTVNELIDSLPHANISDDGVSSTALPPYETNSFDRRVIADSSSIPHFESIDCPSGWRTEQSWCRHDRSPQSYDLTCSSARNRLGIRHQFVLPSRCSKEFDICSSGGSKIYCANSAGGSKIESDPSKTVNRKITQDIPSRTFSGELITANVVLTDIDCTQPMYAESLSLSIAKNLGSGSNVASSSVIDQVKCTDCFNLEIAVPPNAETLSVQYTLAPGATEGLVFIPVFSHS